MICTRHQLPACQNGWPGLGGDVSMTRALRALLPCLAAVLLVAVERGATAAARRAPVGEVFFPP